MLSGVGPPGGVGPGGSGQAEVRGESAALRGVGEFVTEPVPTDAAVRVAIEVGLETIGGVAPDRSRRRVGWYGPEELLVPRRRASRDVEDTFDQRSGEGVIDEVDLAREP